MSDPRLHWDDVYRTKSHMEVSWYQPHATRSIELVAAAAPVKSAAIVDIGCGAATLLGELATLGYTDLTGIDASAVAIEVAELRLQLIAKGIAWVVTDVTTWVPGRSYAVWHDRAVFHFLLRSEAQEGYIRALRTALRPGSTAIIATFAPDGPERCSGLPVQRYSAAELASRLGVEFALVGEAAEHHVTPKGATQSFAYGVFRRQ